MNRTAWLAALVLTLAPGATFAQFGGMGGMGGGGMGGMGGGMGGMGGGMGGMGGSMGGSGSIETRRGVQMEMEGGRRLGGQIALGTIMVYGDVGQYAIHPDRIKMIRFLKPVHEPGDEGGDQQPNGLLMPAQVPGGGNVNAQMMRRINPNNAMNMQIVRAKVILNSGEEIVGNIQHGNGMGFRVEVDYGTMIPAMDKLRTMTFGEIEKKSASTGPASTGPRATGNDPATISAAPQHFRYHQAMVFRSPAGDRIALYNVETKQTLDLSGSKDSPLDVTPLYSNDVMALGLRGRRITRVAVADAPGNWHIQDLRQPVDGTVMPVVAQGIAVYAAGRYAYAYGVVAQRWDVAELPEGLIASPVVGPNTATIEGRGHIYTFAARTGRWDHIDIRAILDAAGAERK